MNTDNSYSIPNLSHLLKLGLKDSALSLAHNWLVIWVCCVFVCLFFALKNQKKQLIYFVNKAC